MEKKFKVGNTTYKRSKYGIGKEIGGKIYVHKNYFNHIIDVETYHKAVNQLPCGFTFNCLMIDKKKSIVRFDEAPDFDTEREPHPGDFIEVNLETMETRKGHSDMIWHHKWMWVDDDYKGFDVEASYEWSRRWTQIITHPSGSRKVWETQIGNAK